MKEVRSHQSAVPLSRIPADKGDYYCTNTWLIGILPPIYLMYNLIYTSFTLDCNCKHIKCAQRASHSLYVGNNQQQYYSQNTNKHWSLGLLLYYWLVSTCVITTKHVIIKLHNTLTSISVQYVRSSSGFYSTFPTAKEKKKEKRDVCLQSAISNVQYEPSEEHKKTTQNVTTEDDYYSFDSDN